MNDNALLRTPTKGNKRLPSSATGSTPKSKQRNQHRPWSPQEDSALLAFVQSNGTEHNGTWGRCAEYMRKLGLDRNSKACNGRYNKTFRGKVADLSSLIKVRTVEVQTEESFLPCEDVEMKIKPPSCESITPTSSHTSSRAKSSTLHLTGQSPMTLRKLLISPMEDGICALSDDSGFLSPVNTDQHEIQQRAGTSRQLFSPEHPYMSTPRSRAVNAGSLAFPKNNAPSLLASLLVGSPTLSPTSRTTPPSSQHTGGYTLTAVTSSLPLDADGSTSMTGTSSRPPDVGGSTSKNGTSSPPLDANDSTSTTGVSSPCTDATASTSILPSDHSYGQKPEEQKVKKKRTKKVRKVKPKVLALAARLETKTKPLTLKERAKLQLAVRNYKSPQSVARSLLAIPTVRESIVQSLADDLGERPKSMQRRKKGFVSVLMRKKFDHLKNGELVTFVSEFLDKFPELFSLVLSVMKPKEKTDIESFNRLIPRLAMVYSIILQARIPNLSRFQRILTMSLAQQICNQKVYDRLNVIGVTLSHQAVDRISKSAPYKELLLSAVQKGKRMRLIGDNLNFMQGVGYESKEKHAHMRHFFASAAIMTERVFTEKPKVPEKPLQDLHVDDVSVTPQIYEEIRKDLVVIVGKVIGKYLLQLQFVAECLPKYLFKPHPEFKKKTEVISLPVLDLNEQYAADTAKILDFYEELICSLPIPEDEPTQVGGDQLTRERIGTATSLRLGNVEPKGRYAHIGAVTFEFFHLGMNYMEKIIFDPLWNATGDEELGTLRGEKQRIIRHSVHPDVHKAYEADKQFYLNYTNAYIIEAALDFFGMQTRLDAPTKNAPPETMTAAEKKAWIYKTVGSFIDEYAFPYWSGHDRDVYVSSEVTEEVQSVVVKLKSGKLRTIRKIKQPTVTMSKAKKDGKKVYGHYVLETGLTYQYFLQLCKTPDRSRLLNLFKLMMVQLKGKSNGAKYPLEILNMMFQQYSELSEQEAHQVLHACFVNTRGGDDANVPADLQMEWVVKGNKGHFKHMTSNKSVDAILRKSSAIAGMQEIGRNYDSDAEVIQRSKTHNPKGLDKDECQIMEDLRNVRPFEFQPGRNYKHPKFQTLEVSQAKNIKSDHFRKWFNKHKKNHLAELEART